MGWHSSPKQENCMLKQRTLKAND